MNHFNCETLNFQTSKVESSINRKSETISKVVDLVNENCRGQRKRRLFKSELKSRLKLDLKGSRLTIFNATIHNGCYSK